MTPGRAGAAPSRPRDIRALVRRALVGHAIVAAVVVAGASVLLALFGDYVSDVRRGRDILLASSRLRADMLSAQSSVRGYLLVAEDRFLEPYRRAVPQMQRGGARLERLLRRDRRLARPARAARATLDEWNGSFAVPVLRHARAGEDARVSRLVDSGAGKRRIDRVRLLLGQIDAEARRQVEALEDRAERLAAFAVAGLAIGAILLLGGLGLLGRRLDRAIARPLAALAATARRVARGDLSARAGADPHGVEEIQVVSREFDHMAGQVETDVGRLRDVAELRAQVVATVAHELRGPLTPIIGYAEGLLEGDAGPLSADQREHAEIVARNAERIEHFIDDLLLLARMEAGQLELERGPVDLGALVKRLCHDCAPAADARGVGLSVAASEVVVAGDARRLEQAVGNLVLNAIKYSRERGGVEIAVHAEGDEAVLAVTDSGVGIAAGELPRLGERFFRASTAHGTSGTGLGLAVTTEIVERHGGRLEIESREGIGSTFRVRLPR